MEVQTFTLWTSINRSEIDRVRGWYERYIAVIGFMARYAPQFSVVDEICPIEQRLKCNLKIDLTIVDERAVGYLVFIVVQFAQRLRENPRFFDETRAHAGKRRSVLSGSATIPLED
jgi:hypothetical protein